MRVHLLDAWALCAARSLSELYLGHTGRAEPCSTRGRCAPRAPPRVHRPVSFVLGVVLRFLAKACGSVIAMVSVAEITNDITERMILRVVQKALEVLDPVTAQKLAEKFKGRVREATRSPRGARRRGRPSDHDLRRPEQVPLWRGKSTWERPPCGLTPAKLLACSSPLPLIISISGSNSWSSVPHASSEPARAFLALARAGPRRPIPRRSAHQLTMPARLGLPTSLADTTDPDV